MVRITDSLSMVLAVDLCFSNTITVVRITDSLSMMLAYDHGTVWLG